MGIYHSRDHIAQDITTIAYSQDHFYEIEMVENITRLAIQNLLLIEREELIKIRIMKNVLLAEAEFVYSLQCEGKPIQMQYIQSSLEDSK